MSEKRTPHHDLEEIKAAFSKGAGAVTKTATSDALSLGCGYDEINAVIQTITSRHFYKSMTSNHDANVWQDVYYAPSEYGDLYVKFTDNGGPDFVLLSFKENENV